MKPIDQKELQQALDKFEQFRPAQPYRLDIAGIAEEFLRRDHARFIGRLNNQLIYVKAKDIAWLQFAKGVTWAVTFEGQRLPLDYSLDQMEKLLDRHQFFRINRQYIVQIDGIKKIMTYYNSRFILQLEPAASEDVIISRERVNDFRSWLEGRLPSGVKTLSPVPFHDTAGTSAEPPIRTTGGSPPRAARPLWPGPFSGAPAPPPGCLR